MHWLRSGRWETIVIVGVDRRCQAELRGVKDTIQHVKQLIAPMSVWNHAAFRLNAAPICIVDVLYFFLRPILEQNINLSQFYAQHQRWMLLSSISHALRKENANYSIQFIPRDWTAVALTWRACLLIALSLWAWKHFLSWLKIVNILGTAKIEFHFNALSLSWWWIEWHMYTDTPLSMKMSLPVAYLGKALDDWIAFTVRSSGYWLG